ncbi:MAG: hypothetical protein G01um101472_325 [Parcubacteria group bacterium Gr01-1014_72]|nr:MAG: hypothetical protein G01um101472_325 [Parcubacteria group bacterium Gr01-1014_72]
MTLQALSDRYLSRFNDTSDRHFTIIDKPVVPPTPSITLTTLNNGEGLVKGSKVTASWQTQNVPNNWIVTIRLNAYDLTGIVRSVFLTTAGETAVGFTVPTDIPSGRYMVVVSACAPPNEPNCVDDASDKPVSVFDGTPNTTPRVVLVSPNGTDTYTKGDSVTALWTAMNIPANWIVTGRLNAYDLTGVVRTLFNTTGDDTAEVFTVPSDVPAGRYVFNISACAPPNEPNCVDDASDRHFTIIDKPVVPPTPSISVLAPEGVSVTKGTHVLFSWSTANVPADWKIAGRLIEHDPRGTSHFTLFENLPTSATSFTAAIPNIPAGRYVFNISACAPPNEPNCVSDYSNPHIDVVEPTTTPSVPAVTLIAPNGGTLTKGLTYTASWGSTNVPSMWAIYGSLESRDMAGLSRRVFTATAAVSSASFAVPLDIPAGQYTFFVECVPVGESGTISCRGDGSDAPLSIVNPPVVEPTPRIMFLTHNSGLSLVRGEATTARWLTEHLDGETLLFRLTRNGAVAHELGILSTANISTTWVVPNNAVLGPGYRLRLEVQGKPSVFAESTVPFEITDGTIPPGGGTPQLRLILPNGGETLVKGANTTVSWVSQGATGHHVVVELVRPNAATPLFIARVPAENTTALQWLVPVDVPAATGYRIRISLNPHVAVSDESDGTFSIVDGTVSSATPVVTSVSPNSAPVGTSIRVVGTGFLAVNSINLLPATGAPTTIANLSPKGDGSLDFTVPSISVGSYLLSVSNQNGTSATVSFAVAQSESGGGGGQPPGGGGGQPSGGGGGGVGGNGPIITTLQSMSGIGPGVVTLFDERIVEIAPGIALLTWRTNIPATGRVVYGTTTPTLRTEEPPQFGYPLSSIEISTTTLQHGLAIFGLTASTTYHFRPVSKSGPQEKAGRELTLTPGVSNKTVANFETLRELVVSCDFLTTPLRASLTNDSADVIRLQLFLNIEKSLKDEVDSSELGAEEGVVTLEDAASNGTESVATGSTRTETSRQKGAAAAILAVPKAVYSGINEIIDTIIGIFDR